MEFFCEKTPRQARKDSKAGKKRLQARQTRKDFNHGRQEKTARQARKDCKAGKKRLQGKAGKKRLQVSEI